MRDEVVERQVAPLDQLRDRGEIRRKPFGGDADAGLAHERGHEVEAEAGLVTSNIAELEKLLLSKRGEVETRLQVLSANSPTIQVLNNEIATLEAQLEKEKDRLSGGSSAAVNELDAKFREIQFNIEFIAKHLSHRLGKKPNAVHQIHFRALAKLRKERA